MPNKISKRNKYNITKNFPEFNLYKITLEAFKGNLEATFGELSITSKEVLLSLVINN